MVRNNKRWVYIIMLLIFCISLPTTVSASVKISKKNITLIKGQTKKLKISGSRKKVKWTSSKKSVVTVTRNGVVKAWRKGTAKITAKVGKKKYICKVKVEAPKINKSKLVLPEGKTAKLVLSGASRKVIWKSSNPYIATVTNKGKIQGRHVGNCTITATTGGRTYTCSITVKRVVNNIPVTGFRLDCYSMELKEGETAKIGTVITPYNATNKTIKWVSSDSSVASVDSYGYVTGKTAGKTTIVAVCNGITEICNVEVVEDEPEVPYITYIGERHTPSDIATHVYISTWQKDEDFDLAGQTYDGGIKISISNTFAVLEGNNGHTVKEITSESHYALNTQALNAATAYDRRFIGKFVVGRETGSSPSTAVISILLDGEEVYKTETVDCFTLDIPPFDVDLTGHREMIVKVVCHQSGDPMVLGMVNRD